MTPNADQSEIVAIVREPIDVRALVAQLARGADGAVVVFEGVVRDHSYGRRTLYLEYEAYEPMALGEMRRLALDVRRTFPIDRIAIVHRLGRLEIGETSVAIVVTSAHRAPAFDACRSAIDRLKKTVPIWKKEYFSDGAVWAEGESDQSL
jgi:molybdopterin synthase catalytic subunit